ncbi:MAG: GNAT family N-acetyltransferase [Muribaculaceae bacterium]|nr:GNAT family N-acetyltransferase [Muribaculaceae bacterium]
MIEIRKITSLDRLMEWRREVIATVFGVKADAALLDANREYYRVHIADKSHVAVVASCDGVDCGCGAICFSEELPSPDNPGGKCAYLMNIYVREAYRNIGVAHSIVRHLLAAAKAKGCDKIYLETTGEGRPVYRSLGFRDMPDMMILWHEK